MTAGYGKTEFNSEQLTSLVTKIKEVQNKNFKYI